MENPIQMDDFGGTTIFGNPRVELSFSFHFLPASWLKLEENILIAQVYDIQEKPLSDLIIHVLVCSIPFLQ